MENTNMPVISAKDLNLWYGDFKALKGISLDVGEREITALIGPSGCGKSTFLKTLNRMNDLVPNVRIEGDVRLKGEPTSALDPGSTMKVEELMSELKKNYTVVIVTHNMQQAARISDRTAFFLLGELVEVGPTAQIFSAPQDKRTEDYISGRFG